MKFRIDLNVPSRKEWVETVLSDFDSFLQDHADCERKASAMALSFVAKYPDRTEIIPDLIDTSVEELEHFRDVYAIMKGRGIRLSHEIPQDMYIKKLLQTCRSGRDERFMDRLLMASLVETRGAERFKLIYEGLGKGDLKDFYHRLWASEARHGEIFVKMALIYFEEDLIYKRLEEMKEAEGVVLQELPLRPALH